MEGSEQSVANNSFKSKLGKLGKRWFNEAFTGMAQGLFVTLIAGTIIKTLGQLIGENTAVGGLCILVGSIASTLMGAGIGAGIASHLKAPKLVIFATMVAGFVGAFSSQFIGADFAGGNIADITILLTKGLPGNPIGAYVTALLACELGILVAGKTKLDILIVPFVCLTASIFGAYISFPFIWLVNMLGKFIAIATQITPFFMGVIIAVIMGVLLTMPTSSAAIWVAVASPILANPATAVADYNAMLIAGGAAVIGCSCQMVGFATMSFKENGFSGLISQGLGTSMLQIPNVMKNPKILLPPIIASIVCGPIATVAFKLKCGASGGGMGTCGFVGIIDAYNMSVAMGGMNVWIFILAVVTIFFVLPAVISYFSCELFRKIGWIKEGDLKLPE